MDSITQILRDAAGLSMFISPIAVIKFRKHFYNKDVKIFSVFIFTLLIIEICDRILDYWEINWTGFYDVFELVSLGGIISVMLFWGFYDREKIIFFLALPVYLIVWVFLRITNIDAVNQIAINSATFSHLIIVVLSLITISRLPVSYKRKNFRYWVGYSLLLYYSATIGIYFLYNNYNDLPKDLDYFVKVIHSLLIITYQLGFAKGISCTVRTI